MKTHFIEATNGPQNWGKFLLMQFEKQEWETRSVVAEGQAFLRHRWTPNHVIVFDLETGEGAFFSVPGSARADLDKRRIWVCPLFEPFLVWLYDQDISDLDSLPPHIDLPDAEFMMYGYRRNGQGGE